METIVFVIAGAAILAGAVGVVLAGNPVHSALSLVATLFGVAVLFVAQNAHFLAAVQVIVYAGAIVVLFLFVIMLLGVDRSDDLSTEPLGGQRPGAIGVAVGLLGVALTALFVTREQEDRIVTGASGVVGTLGDSGAENPRLLGHALFTNYLFAFEVTSALLVIAVVAAVVLSRRPTISDQVDEAADIAEESAS